MAMNMPNVKNHGMQSVSELKKGETFRYHSMNGTSYWMVIRPEDYLANSRVMKGVIDRGDALCVNIFTGALRPWIGATKVKVVDFNVSEV